MSNSKIVYRHLRRTILSCKSVGLELFTAILLFGLACLFDPINVILKMMYFLIILEITRMVIEYIKSPNHRVKIRYLVDASIIASLREVIIIIVDSKNITNNTSSLIVYGIVTALFILLRLVVMKISPDEYEPEYCNIKN